MSYSIQDKSMKGPNFVDVFNYDGIKGYIGDAERLHGFNYEGKQYLADEDFLVPDLGKVYRVIGDDGRRTEIKAMEIKDISKKDILRDACVSHLERIAGLRD